MKRYLVFQYDQYYPSGGLEDVTGSFDNLEDAREASDVGYHDCVTIFDRLDGVEVS